MNEAVQSPSESEVPRRRPGMLVTVGSFWVASAATLVTSAVRGKASAAIIGPEGMGLVAQLTSISVMVGGLSTLGMSGAGIKLIAQYSARGDWIGARRVAAFVLWAPMLICAVFFVPALLALRPLSGLLLGAPYQVPLLLALLSVPLNLLVGSAAVVLQGFGRAARMAWVNITAVIVNTAIVIGLLVGLNLWGAILGVLATSLASLLLYVIREPWVFGMMRHFNGLGSDARQVMLKLGGASFALGALSLLVDTFTRALVIRVLGLDANGLYQPVHMASVQGFVQLCNGIATFLLPSLAALVAAKKLAAVRSQLSAALSVGMYVVASASLACMATAPIGISLLFTSEFASSSGVLSAQSAAEPLRMAAYVLGALLVPLGLTRLWLLLGLATLAVQVGVTSALLSLIGLYALPLGFSAGWALNLTVVALLARRRRLVADSVLRSAILLPQAVVLCGLLMTRLSPSLAINWWCAALCAAWVVVAMPAVFREKVRILSLRVLGRSVDENAVRSSEK